MHRDLYKHLSKYERGMPEMSQSNLFSNTNMDLTLISECSTPEMFSKTQDFLRQYDCTRLCGIDDVSQVSLLNSAMLSSSICSEDIVSPHSHSGACDDQRRGAEVQSIMSNEKKALLSRSESPKGKYRRFVNYCNHKAKKVLRKFKGAGKPHAPQEVDEGNVFSCNFLHMQRIHTPKMLHNFSRGVQNRSTPGGILQRRTILAGRTPRFWLPAERTNRVAFRDDQVIEDRSAQIKRVVVNLREAAEFLETL